LEGGVKNVDKLIKFEAINKMLKAALPHLSSYVDQIGFNGYHYLLEELEERLL
jgi:hypothetical protein